MKSGFWNLLTVSSIACTMFATSALAEPIEFSEVSLLVRARESESSITQEVARRKLVRPLTPQQENTVRSQGATDSLIQALRASAVHLAQADAAAFESRRDQAQKVSRTDTPRRDATSHQESNGDDIHIFNVAFGQPINLSQWGGLDYEIAFHSYRFAGEDLIEPVMIDQFRSVTEVSRPIRFTSEDEAFSRDRFPTNEVRNRRYTPYDTRVDQRDTRLQLNDTVSVRSNSATRRLMIDWQNPVFMQGQPYAFYRVYGAGDVSLYYISKASDRSARVAVVSRR
ncbi:MAG: hypothetical protein AVDCRST_MAG42-2899 [uncultured Chthoniobacterales bacterium]|uniref:Uncharacterized protein n=1 Tax=uncultured Chthoniobacterales bacterium TaxID=1836801 RepID=A0A6J4J0E2_9BACT|nr:MAG: hypothetical protein AVDCRST_MAG42-2899 [uncultured Chthoniobacterales bacterium]